MGYRSSIGAMAIAAALAMTFAGAQAFDDAKYPDMKGQWLRVGVPNWQAVNGPPPLTPEYQAIYNANRADMVNGGPGNVPSWYCLPQGMPMMMNIYDPMEIVITEGTTHFLIQHVHDSRRVFTDGRPWPKEIEPTFAGYSIGKWLDTDGDGRFDTLEIESRAFRGPRSYDATGLPLHEDNQSIIKERISLDKSDPKIMLNEITTIDNALTRPWTATKRYRRVDVKQPVWPETVCGEGNAHLDIGGQNYMLSADGLLMPARKGQKPPDLRYFNTQAK
jgi:hypothetical protein